MRIFLSYGHDSYEKIAVKVMNELTAAGHEVWFDKKNLRGSMKWEDEIEKAIQNCDWFVVLMTEHSMRRPNGVCLDEISSARYRNLRILPVMVQNVKPPFCIARVQWLDMMDGSDSSVMSGIEKIKSIISDPAKLDTEGSQAYLFGIMKPLDNEVYYEGFRKDFRGREWLDSMVEEWMADPKSPKVLSVVGGAGSGKTAFVSSMCCGKESVAGIHMCRYDRADHSDTKKALASLAYSLSNQIPEYREALLSMPDLADLMSKSPADVFDLLFVDAAHKVRSQSSPVVLIIDALDEMDRSHRSTLIRILNSESSTPDWLKIMVTTRPDPEVMAGLNKVRSIRIEDHLDNERDIREYVEFRLSSSDLGDADYIVRKIMANCGGNFMYAKGVVNDLVSGDMPPDHLDRLSTDIYSYYLYNFQRMFADPSEFKDSAGPFLQFAMALFDPVPADEIIEMMADQGYDDFEIGEALRRLGAFFPIVNGYMVPVHKSVYDWLVDRGNASFRINLTEGHKKVARALDSMLENGSMPDWGYLYCARHNIKAKNYRRAAELLSDPAIQSNRARLLQPAYMAQEYMTDLEMLDAAVSDKAIVKMVLDSEYFRTFARDSMPMIMLMGKAMVLARCGFGPQAEAMYGSTDDPDTRYTVAVYFHSVGETRKAMGYLEELRRDLPRERTDLRSQCCDLLGLAYKKYLRYEDGLEAFQESVDIAEDGRQRATSVMNQAKIYYHMLEWEKAKESVREGVRLLREHASDPSTPDHERLFSEAFSIEFIRTLAEVAMWEGDVETCDRCYEETDELMRVREVQGLYLSRYRHTRMFVSMLKGEDLPDAEWEEALGIPGSRFDLERIRFYRGLYLHCKGEDAKAAEWLSQCTELCRVMETDIERVELEVAQELCGGPEASYGCAELSLWEGHCRKLYAMMERAYGRT